MLKRWWPKRESDQLIGLEIGARSLKLLKVNATNAPFVVEAFAIVPLPADVFVKDEIKDYTALGTALKTLIKQAGISARQVALSIPRSSVIIKNTTVDNRLNSAEIESRAWIEANRHFPELVGEIYLDYNITGPSPQDSSQLELMLVACRKGHIKPYLDVLRLAGLTAKIIDVDCYALERALVMTSQKVVPLDTVALLNLDYSLSTLVVMQKNTLIYAHDHTYDGYRLMTQAEAYLKDKTSESQGDPVYQDILKESLSAHLRHTMHFFYSSRPHITIQKVILSGDIAGLPGVAPFLQQEIGVETTVANPFQDMQIASNVDPKKLQQFASAMMLCCGLALSKTNGSSK